MQGVPVLTAVEQAIGSELLEAEQVLADELQSENPYVSDILQHSTRFRGEATAANVTSTDGESVRRNSQ